MKRSRKLVFRPQLFFKLLAFSVVLVAAAYATDYVRRHFFLDNFGVVEEGLIYRSGQPTPHQLEDFVRAHGIRTVINAREPDAPEELMAAEQRTCDALGVRMVRLPMPGDGRADFEQFDAALAVLKNPTNLPVLVHCARGSYRSGAIIAAYRVLVQGRSEKDAIDEMAKYRAHMDRHALTRHLHEYLESREAGK